MRPAIEAVVFDWGGTLSPWRTIDSADPWRAYATAADPARADERAAALCAAEAAAWILARDRHQSSTLDDVFAAAGVDVTGDRHAAGLAAYLEFWRPHCDADPEAADLLRRLRAAGLRVGVLSNTLWPSAVHEEIFERDGLAELIDAAVYTSSIAWTKPHPGPFRAVLSALEVDEPARAVFVGDRLCDDVYGAQQLGMRTIYLPHSDIPAEQVGDNEGVPDVVVQRLSEVEAAVNRWRRSSD
jgi:putative hydrolase of the HAD superfamily